MRIQFIYLLLSRIIKESTCRKLLCLFVGWLTNNWVTGFLLRRSIYISVYGENLIGHDFFRNRDKMPLYAVTCLLQIFQSIYFC